MGDVQAVAGFDRLPWLADEPQTRAPRKRRRMWPLWLAAALAALIAVAGAAYWMGMQSSPADQPGPTAAPISRPPVTIPLPAPIEVPPPQPEVAIEPLPQVAPVALPAAPATREAPKARRGPLRAHARAKAIRRAAPAARAKIARPKPAATKNSAALPIWPVRAEQNAAGRLVRVGTFATAHQAKRGWGKIMRFYPGMKRLPALVVPIRAVPSGRRYYRLQMGTTSQAHSEVLCQRMRLVGVSCVVLDIGTRRR